MQKDTLAKQAPPAHTHTHSICCQEADMFAVVPSLRFIDNSVDSCI